MGRGGIMGWWEAAVREKSGLLLVGSRGSEMRAERGSGAPLPPFNPPALPDGRGGIMGWWEAALFDRRDPSSYRRDSGLRSG